MFLGYKWLPVVWLALVLTGCATDYSPAAHEDPYGFFSGIWHGAIFLFAAFGCLLSWFLSLVGISLAQRLAFGTRHTHAGGRAEARTLRF